MQGEIKKLKAERDTMLAQMQSAQARLKIQEQLDGLSVDAEVKALDNVRDAHQDDGRRGEPRQGALRDLARRAPRGAEDPGGRRAGQAAARGAEGQAGRRAGGAGPEDDVIRAGPGTGAGRVSDVGERTDGASAPPALLPARERDMKLTPFAKLFITVVILGVVGYAVWHYKGDTVRKWAGAEKGAGAAAKRRRRRSRLRRAEERPRRRRARQGLRGRHRRGARRDRQARPAARRRHQHLGGARAGHRLQRRAWTRNPASIYKQKYGLDVKFVLLEDPAAKLAAFRKGDVDIMWDTVDNWAREASILAEQGAKAKSIILQDWSRGGDGIVSLSSIKSIEDLKGQEDRLHAVHAVALPPPLPALAVGPHPGGPRRRREGDHLHAGRAGRRRHVQGEAGRRGRDLGAGPLRAPSTARGDEAHVLVSTTAATNIIADTLVRPAGPHRLRAPRPSATSSHGWFDGIEMMKADPAGVVRRRRQRAEARRRDRLRDALRPQAHPLRRQRAVLRPRRRQGALRDALRHRVRHLAQEGGGHPGGRREGLGRHRASSAALASAYPAQKVEEPKIAAKAPSAKDRAIINKQIQIHFTPGSDEIMPGSFFILDALGETMTSFGNTYLRVEGNTDATGSATANMQLSERRAVAVKNYIADRTSRTSSRPASRRSAAARRTRSPTTRPRPGRQLNRRTDIKVVLRDELKVSPRGLFALRAPLPKATALALGFVMPALVLGAWCVASYGGLAPADFLPSPTEVVRGTLQLFLEHDLFEAILVSTRRILLAFLLASAVALPLGVLMGAFEPVNRLFEPIVSPLRYMPISAFIPLLILWFGIYEKQKIAFLFLGVFVYLLPVVVTAIRAVPEEYVQTALTLGASRVAGHPDGPPPGGARRRSSTPSAS